MKKAKRLSAIVLSIVMIVSAVCSIAASDKKKNVYEDYVNVFVHGLYGWGEYDSVYDLLPYWGLSNGDMIEYLSKKGYKAVAASVGPMSSCHDRCCELFAQLTGTVTDYGEAHIEMANKDFADKNIDITHERFGRSYKGNALITGWGPKYSADGTPTGEWYDSKINLFGHSFGGPTIVEFLQLLVDGDEQEREAAKAKWGDDWKKHCSPLFWGIEETENREIPVNAITSLAGVLNGTTFIDTCSCLTEVVSKLSLIRNNLTGVFGVPILNDFQLEQFGITNSDNPDYDYYLDFLRAASFFEGVDNAIYDLSIEGANKLKLGWKCYDSVYYFAYSANTTVKSQTGILLPKATTASLFLQASCFIGSYTNKSEIVTDIYGNPYTVIDEKWHENDGIVNTISETYVFGCEHMDYNGTVVSGKWITMPTVSCDHVDFIGALLKPTTTVNQTKTFFNELMNNITSTYEISKRLATPELYVTNINFSNAVMLKWNRVEGADGYRIYRSSSRNGSYSLIKITSGTGFTDITTIPGRTYYYKIVASDYGDAVKNSEYSEILGIKVRFFK